MGYEFHLTRRRLWHDDEGPAITAAEWLEVVAGDPELELDPRNGPYFANCARAGEEDHWLDWRDGDLFTKHPEDWFVRKMQELAGRLDAVVQGDEGEVYDGDYPPPQPEPAEYSRWQQRLARAYMWLRSLTRRRPPVAEQTPFRVGDRVRHIGGFRGTVVGVDRWAEFGWGYVRVRLDDGREMTGFMFAGVFDPAGEKGGEEPPAGPNSEPMTDRD